jgi:hypothetical protein
MFKRVSIALAVVCLATGPAVTQAKCPLTYATFEFAIPHLDLEACPKEFAREGVFCRASIANDMVHVFAFSHSDEQCLLSVKSYKPDQYQLSVK